jgi:hypothetical protein
VATLTIRNIPDPVHRGLRLRAARSGRSVEAEVREILSQASAASDLLYRLEDTLSWIDQQLGDARPEGVVDELIAERRAEAARQ